MATETHSGTAWQGAQLLYSRLNTVILGQKLAAQFAIRVFLKNVITPALGLDNNGWWDTVPLNHSGDIYRWATPERIAKLEQGTFTETRDLKGAINIFLDNINSFINKLGGILAMPLLAPFKAAMKKGLANKGYPTSGNLKEIAIRFIEKIIKPRKPDNDMSEGFEYGHRRSTRGTALANFESMEPFTVKMIVEMVIEFFKAITGAPKDANEQEMADIAAKDAARAQQLIDEEQNGGGGSIQLGGIVDLLFLALTIWGAWKFLSR